MADAIKPILVVDDDEPTQKLMGALMRRFGYTTESAMNGGKAIELLAVREYSLVVLDLMMPTVGGREVLDYLDSVSKRTPVVICTAAGPARTNEVDSPLVKAVVRKPFDIDHFAALIGSITGGSAPPIRVLIVDDDARSRYLLRSFVSPAEVIEAETGDGALQMLKRARPDVVLLDLVMPGMPGEEFLRRIRDEAETSAIPVIVVTSQSLSEEARQDLLRYAAGVIYKGHLSRESLADALKGVRKAES